MSPKSNGVKAFSEFFTLSSPRQSRDVAESSKERLSRGRCDAANERLWLAQRLRCRGYR